MTDEQKQIFKEYQEKHREAKNKLKKDKYHNMNDEEKQKLKDYQKNIEKI